MLVLKRAKYLYRTEGLVAVIKRVLEFLSRFIFQYKCYYIIMYHTPGKLEEKDYLPALSNYVFKRIENKDISAGDPRAMYLYNRVADARERLNSGAVAFCIFYGDELVNIGWVALTGEAHRSLFQPAYKVDFAAGEVSTGGGWTNPAYRGRGLATYEYFKRLEYIWSKGKKAIQTAVQVDNIASLKMHARFSPMVRVKGRDLKILWHRSWKETPVNIDVSKVIK